MTSSNEEDQNFSVSVPIGAAVSAILLALAAAAAYALLGRTDETATETISSGSKSRKNVFRKFGLMGLVTLIENDATRKVVVAVLKAMARRS